MTTPTKQAYDAARYARLRDARNADKAPDPITLLSTEDRCYLAGIIDGEGSIFVASLGSAAKRLGTFHPIVVVAMTHRPVIDWIAERLGARPQIHNQTAQRRNPHHRTQWRVQVTGRRAQLLCEAIAPFLRVKHEQAALVLAFPVDARRGPGRGLTDDIRSERARIRTAMSALNAAD